MPTRAHTLCAVHARYIAESKTACWWLWLALTLRSQREDDIWTLIVHTFTSHPIHLRRDPLRYSGLARYTSRPPVFGGAGHGQAYSSRYKAYSPLWSHLTEWLEYLQHLLYHIGWEAYNLRLAHPVFARVSRVARFFSGRLFSSRHGGRTIHTPSASSNSFGASPTTYCSALPPA
jgi:hypothetical protein